MKKKVALSLLALIVAGCVLLSIGLMVGVYFLFQAQKNYVPPAVVVTESPEIETQMDQIQQEVTAIRGLSLKTDLNRALMTPTELKETVVNDFFKDYTPEDAQNDAEVLSTLGLLKPGFDLRQFYLDLYTEQVAGYYDSSSKEMYVIADGNFGGLERMTYAHEFTHALQDQNYDLENGLKLNDDYCQLETEYCAAVSALVEGDATLSDQFWFLQYSTDLDKNQVSQFQQTYKSPVYDSAPLYMKNDFLFPYQQGFDFVNQLYGRKKWQSIDDAFKNPPVSTEQILHPEKYPLEKPVLVSIPDLLPILGTGWTEIDRNVMGEWYSYLVFSSGINSQFRVSDETAKTAAAGWGGDTYVYYSFDATDRYLFAWRSAWDSVADTGEFFSTSRDYGLARWGAPSTDNISSVIWTTDVDGTITIRKSGKDVLWVMSNDQAAYTNVLSGFTDFRE
ncbi:MAG: hypothetical protein C0401_05550 [Anaerolinea sp.]|nr:hypothetical protein [Anaerolinea sp.]